MLEYIVVYLIKYVILIIPQQAYAVEFVWLLLSLKLVSSTAARVEVYSIQPYVITFANDLQTEYIFFFESYLSHP